MTKKILDFTFPNKDTKVMRGVVGTTFNYKTTEMYYCS